MLIFGKMRSEMPPRNFLVPCGFTLLLVSAVLFGQTRSGQTQAGQAQASAPTSPVALEFPVTMRQNVIAGKTAVGTKVKANLAVATLVKGVVIPQDAILSGEVTESAPKSETDPSRLAIRIDSAEWKNGSLSFAPAVYLTAWYYPPAPMNLNSGDTPDASHNSAANTAVILNPGGQPFPNHNRDMASTMPNPPTNTSAASQHRALMKNIETTRNGDGAVILTSSHSNIKLDKSTTYVLATGDLAAHAN